MLSRKKAQSTNVNKKPPINNRSGKGVIKKKAKPNSFNAPSRNLNLQGSAAAAYSTGNSGKAPKVVMSKDSCRVMHRELLGNVSGTSTAAFVVANTFALNPGLVATFPWLSNMAQNWESYRFNSLRVCYYTRTGSNTAGSVILVPDYDASDASPISEQTASSYEDIQEDAPWKDICCTLRPTAMHNIGPRKFVRSGTLPVNTDVKLYDVGNLFICTVDSAAAASWGKLWIEYDVTFYTPQLFPQGSNFSTVAAIAGGSALTNTNIFGSVVNGINTSVVTGNMNVTAALNVLSVSGLIVGAEYMLSCSIVGTVITNFNVSGQTGMNQKNGQFAGFTAAATTGNVTFTFVATASSGTITLTCTATTVTASETLFSLIPTASF